MLANALLAIGLGASFSLLYIAQMARYAPDLAWPALCVLLVSLALCALTTLVQIRVTKRPKTTLF